MRIIMVAVEDVSEDELFCGVVITEQLGIVSFTALLLLLLLLTAVCNVEHKLEFETIAAILLLLLLLLFVASKNSLRLFEFNGNIGLPKMLLLLLEQLI